MSFQFPASTHIHSALDSHKPVDDFSSKFLVQTYDINNSKMVFKFVGSESARNHSLNTELFRFFDLSFVPCEVLEIAAKSRMSAMGDIYSTKDNHVVVMPFQKGESLEKLFEQKDDTIISPLKKKMRDEIPKLLISMCSDAQPRNVIAENATDITIIDAEWGFFNQSQPHIMPIYTAMLCNYHMYYIDESIPLQIQADEIQYNLETASLIFQEKIERDFPQQLNINGARETLLKNAQLLPNINVAKIFHRHC